MNKGDIVEAMAFRMDSTKREAAEAFDALIEVVKESVAAGKPVSLNGIGKFKFSRRDARIARNPSNGEMVNVPAKTHVSFSVSWPLKQEVADVMPA